MVLLKKKSYFSNKGCFLPPKTKHDGGKMVLLLPFFLPHEKGLKSHLGLKDGRLSWNLLLFGDLVLLVVVVFLYTNCYRSPEPEFFILVKYSNPSNTGQL